MSNRLLVHSNKMVTAVISIAACGHIFVVKLIHDFLNQVYKSSRMGTRLLLEFCALAGTPGDFDDAAGIDVALVKYFRN